MVVCPHESCSYDSTEHGIKLHHKRSHGESLAKTTFVCDYCSQNFSEYKCNREGHENVFCSPECREGYKRDQSTVNWYHICEWCGNEFRRHPSLIYDHKFCSTECHHNWQRKNPDKLHLWDGGKIEVNCEWCEKCITRKPHRVNEQDRHYCSKDCMGNWRSENLVGENASNWQGGYEPYYGASWPAQRNKAIERDDSECQNCGLTMNEHIEIYDKELEVHHQKPLRTFDKTNKANKLNNLITLCSKCHSKIEHNEQ